MTLQRWRLRVTGVVQGVGFRPFVYGLAQQQQLTGFVGNDSQGVFIEVEGTPDALHRFQQQLEQNPPPLARIEQVQVTTLPLSHDSVFVIVASETLPGSLTLISPDLSICDDCLHELFDPQDRRYRYAFITCTHCGPRFTIIRDVPYDRPQTVMDVFPLCDACATEYHNPADRRFHAQPVACPDCGPQLEFIAPQTHLHRDDALRAAQQTLCTGQIVAIKGLGGFHLACDATADEAVKRLRERKQRPAKPLAIMAKDLESVREYVRVNDDEAALLTARERPIVLLQKHPHSTLAAGIAPGNASVGVMLPYTPLHALLLHDLDLPLVMTSGNISGEPIITDNDDAQTKLAGIADAFLLHDRAIHVPCDDSVVRVLNGQELPVRRSRGYAPFPLRLPETLPSVLAVGGELKNTFCLTRDHHAFMSQHIGDMANLATLNAFNAALDHMLALFRIQPEAIVCDEHPGYLSSRRAEQLAQQHNLPLIRVQHHHAHITAVMAEHGLSSDERVIGFSFDGTGYGTDETIWGGEVLLTTYAGFERVAHLATVPLAGGDRSVQHPYRMALAHLWAAGIAWDETLPPVAACPPVERRILQHQLKTGLNAVPTSSMGRFFDAVSSLIGICHSISYEAQAAIELEGIADDIDDSHRHDTFALHGDSPIVIDPAPVLQQIIRDLHSGQPVSHIAGHFHNGLAQLILTLSEQLRQRTTINTVALSGGIFQNVRLLRLTLPLLHDAGFRVLTHHHLPPNDGGLAAGQAIIAGYQLKQTGQE